MDRLTKRANNGMPYLAKVKDDETAVEGSYNTLKCIQEAFEKLAKYEESEEKVHEGCEYCNERNMPLWWNNAGHPSESLIEPNFCPMCGKKLTN